ncbi:MAG TPA: YihY/virulence factor BrkB family protein, partial [Actinomycetota bacterium]|nr:YihY/virulence factor BrkB family protein [Actinomycetota bacterium]
MSTATAVPQTYELEGDDARETLRGVGRRHLLRDSFERFRAADGFSHARALAFQIVLTAFPALIAVVGLTLDLDQDDLRRLIQETIRGVAPGPAGEILTQAFQQGSDAASDSGTAIFVGLAAALIAATGAMGQIERGANRIYGVESDRSSLRKYVTAFVLAVSVGVLILVAFVMFIAGSAIEDAGAATGWSDTAVTIWEIVRWPVVLVFVLAGFSLLFKVVPRRRQPSMSWLAAGAIVTVVLWFAFTGLLSLYLTASEAFGDTYGPLAGIIGLLLWAFLTSLAVFFGLASAAQLEAVRAGVTKPATDEDANPSPTVGA